MNTPLQSLTPVAELKFEHAMQELESLVHQLEEGQMTLEDMIAACERGTALKKHCDTKLQQVQARIDQIIVTPEGTISAQPMENV
ncbi:MAG: exodeoxyribonuclease VII small subunit [Pseudomonadota bacterium]